MIGNNKATVKRSKRRTASIYIERDGSLSILVPENTSEQEIKESIYQVTKSRWHG
jgi:hypothetical protein